MSDLAKRSGTHPATISNILNRNRGVGRAVAYKLARGLNLGEAVVLFRAGITNIDPKSIREQLDAVTLEILALVEPRPVDQKRLVRDMIRTYLNALSRGTNGQSDG